MCFSWCDFLIQTSLNRALLLPSVVKLLAKQGWGIQTNAELTSNGKCQAYIAELTSPGRGVLSGGVDLFVPGYMCPKSLVGALFTLSPAPPATFFSSLLHYFSPIPMSSDCHCYTLCPSVTTHPGHLSRSLALLHRLVTLVPSLTVNHFTFVLFFFLVFVLSFICHELFWEHTNLCVGQTTGIFCFFCLFVCQILSYVST